MTPTRTGSHTLKFIYLSIIVILALEIPSYFCTKYLNSHGIGYILPGPDKYILFSSKSDPLLGWPTLKSCGNGVYDYKGARINPRANKNYSNCISMFGDSFTFAAEVKNEESFGSYLTDLLKCNVVNYGVGGYGTDQAYLRYTERVKKDERISESKIVILGILSENILRILNRFRPLLVGSGDPAFKPRFIFNKEHTGLQLLKAPRLSVEEYKRYLRSPDKIVSDDYFEPGTPAGNFPITWPYTLDMIKSFGHFRAMAWLQGKGHWEDFYIKSHPTDALELLTLISAEFNKTIKAQYQIPLVVIIPLARDLMRYQDTGEWSYLNFLDNLQSRNILYLNIGDGLIDYLNGDDPCKLFTYCHGGHYNSQTNKVVADLIYKYLNKKKLLNLI